MMTNEATRTQTAGSPQEATSPAELRKYRLRWWTLAVVSVTLVLETLDETILNVALPTLQRELGASASGLQWMVNSYILVFGGLLLIMGGLGDRFGRARMLQGGLVVFGVASLAGAYTDTTGQLIAARAVMGAGAAMMMPATLSIIVDLFKGTERAKAISIWAALSGVGLLLGPVLGGLLLRNFYWGSVFLVNVPIAGLALVATIFLVPDSRDPEAKPLDIPGAILSAGAISALIYAIIQGPDQGWTSPQIWGSMVAAVLLGIGFAIRETRTRYPLLDFTFFRRARFSTGAAAISLSFFALAALIFGMTQYLQFVKGYTPLEAGIRFLPASLGLMVGAIGSETLARRYGTTKVVSGGMVALATTMPLVLLWEVDTPYWAVGVAIAVIGFAAANIFAPATEAVMGAVPEEKAGIGSAMNDITRLIATALGIAVIGSAMNSIYSSKVAAAVAALPAEAATAAKDSVGAALQIAASLPGDSGAALSAAAAQAFTDAFGLAILIGAAVTLLGAVVVARVMPARQEPLSEPASEPVPPAAPLVVRQSTNEAQLADVKADLTYPETSHSGRDRLGNRPDRLPVSASTTRHPRIPPVIRVLRFLIRSTDRVSPRLAGRVATRLWFTPGSHRRRARHPSPLPDDILEFPITLGGQPLWAFSAGTGREIVLLIHGWGASADRLAHFIGPFTDAGLRVVGVDLPAHGRTPGRQTDPLELAGAVRAIADQLGGVHAIVAHSMGAFATTLAMKEGLALQRVVFIAPLVRVEAAFRRFRQMLNLPPRTAKELRRRLTRRFGENMFRDFALDHLASEFDAPALIIHAPEDTEVPYNDAEALAGAWKTASVVEAPGLGHRRILRDPAVVDRTVRFISAGRHNGQPTSNHSTEQATTVRMKGQSCATSEGDARPHADAPSGPERYIAS